MKSKPSQIPLMNIGKDEEIFAGRVSPHIPEVGVYKILAKKKADGTIEWAHFVQRDDGLKDRVMRGTVNNREEFNIVIDTVDKNLRRIFGVTTQPAEFDVRTLDGVKASNTKH